VRSIPGLHLFAPACWMAALTAAKLPFHHRRAKGGACAACAPGRHWRLASGSLLLPEPNSRRRGTWKKWFRTRRFLSDRSAVAVEGFESTVPLSTLVRFPCLRAARISTAAIDQQQNQSFRCWIAEFQKKRPLPCLQGMRLSLTVALLRRPPFFSVAPAQAYVSAGCGPVCPAPSMALQNKVPVASHSNQPEEVFGPGHLTTPHRVPPGSGRPANRLDNATFTSTCEFGLMAHAQVFSLKDASRRADAMCAGAS